MNKFLAKIVAWVNAGYPEGAPRPDRVPLLALLITEITDEMPLPEVVGRVRDRLAAKGWPLDDPRDIEEAE